MARSAERRPQVPRFEFKYASDLMVGDWAQIAGTWAEVQGCATDANGWTHLALDGFPLPETILHRSVEVPWSRTQPAGVA
jgi:hypothetical protein